MSGTESLVTDLPPTARLTDVSVFGVKAVTRDTDGRLDVDDRGLGELPPLGELPAVMVCKS